jgi:galactokinase
MNAAGTPTSNISAPSLSAAEAFRIRFSAEPVLFRAPGRVNLIGEHTDYNGGFVMPAALGLSTYVAVGSRDDRELHVFSINFNELRVFSLNSLLPAPAQHWTDYVRGVAGVLVSRGLPVRGANIVIQGGVPIGSGLSSSAALEVATAFALLRNSDISLERREVALVCQQAEHQYAGMHCGIMDQFISCFGHAGNALLLDCRSLAHELLPLPDGYRIVICNSGVKHDLASSEYNARRVSCEQAVTFLRQYFPEVRELRDVSLDQLLQHRDEMDGVVFRRARHVVSEIERTLEAAESLKCGEMNHFGELMVASHCSLRDDYEVSCRELDILMSSAMEIKGVIGARMTGGGFGGCTVNLVRDESVAEFKRKIAAGYESSTGIIPQIYVCDAADGAGQISEAIR